MKEIERISPKEEFLNEMEKFIKDSLPVEWDEDARSKSAAKITSSKIKTGAFTSIPMICKGPQCPFKDTCPYFQDGTAPIGSPCPLELGMVRTFMADYIDRLEIDLDNWVELSQVRSLVDQEVQMIRKSKYLAKEDFIQENVVGIDSDGDAVFKKEMHLAVDWEDRILKRQAQLYKQLLATREAKVKAGAAQIDSAQSLSGLMNNLRKFEEQKEVEIKQRLGIVDVDEYIETDKDNKEE